MEDLKWLEVAVDTTEEELDGLCARLTANGVTGFAIEDEADFKAFLEQNHQYWDYVDEALEERMRGVCRVKFYVTDDDHGKAHLKQWMEGIDRPYTLSSLGDNDWAHSWQKYYKPMAVGEKLWIVPEWEKDQTPPEGRTPVYLNPGLTFGTGNHASGLNGIGRDRYTVRAGDVLSDQALVKELGARRYPLVLANIVADVIMPLAAKAGEWLTGDGVFLCSGIIDTRADEVQAALERCGLRIIRRREQNGWVSLAARNGG